MKIAVFLPNWIGDVVMATPALRTLRQHFPSARLTGVMRPYVAGVLEGSPWLDEQVFLDKGGPLSRRWPAVAWTLRRARFDIALLFSNSFRTGLVAWLGKCRQRVGFRRYARDRLLTTALEPIRDSWGRLAPSPIIDAYNQLVQSLGCPPPGYQQELFTTAQDEQAADGVWGQAGLDHHAEVVCFNPGAAYGAAKFWDSEYFARLARDLCDRRGCAVLILCGPREKELARAIARLAARPAVHALADLFRPAGTGQNGSDPPLSLGLSKACVRRADLLISTDSGPRHFAAAFQRPVVTLFGPTHIAWTETYYPGAVHLQKHVACGPCQLRTCPVDHRCMKLLTPQEVYMAAAELLARFPKQKNRAASAFGQRKVC